MAPYGSRRQERRVAGGLREKIGAKARKHEAHENQSASQDLQGEAFSLASAALKGPPYIDFATRASHRAIDADPGCFTKNSGILNMNSALLTLSMA